MARAATRSCRCCPYGVHIDVGFVTFAEDVARGHSNNRRTPTMSRRNLTSPMESIFSDSMENIMSDFEEVLATEKPKEAKMPFNQRRLQNGYTSDYTGYRTTSAGRGEPREESNYASNTMNGRSFALDFSGNIAPPKPVNRSQQQSNSNGRSTPSAYTALGRTISEMRARNAESPLPDRDRNSSSRVGTPIDLGIPPRNNATSRSYSEHHRELRQVEPERPSQLTMPRSNLSSEGRPGDFASLRRGREVALPETEHRVRYFSASPKLPRRLVAAPPMPSPSNFTYTHQNGHTVLAKTQATSTSPPPPVKRAEMRTMGTSTGPLPPQKPCGECHALRKELEAALERIPAPRPAGCSIGIGTDFEVKLLVPTCDVSIGESVFMTSFGVGTEQNELVERGGSSIDFGSTESSSQTEVVTCVDIEVEVSPEVQDGDSQYIPPFSCHFGCNTDEVEDPEKKDVAEKETMTNRTYYRNIPSQTEHEEEVALPTSSGPPSPSDHPSCSESASQTDGESCEPRVLEDSEITESLWLMPGRETVEVAVGPDEGTLDAHATDDCDRCSSKENTFMRNVGVGACAITDKVCVSCDNCPDEVDENDVPGFQQPKALDGQKLAAVKKLLTSEQKQPFKRGTVATKSARIERKKSNENDWVDLRRVPSASPTTTAPSVPTQDTADALKSKVVLKKEIPPPPSSVPDPVPARIPRPKVSKYAPPQENAETADEADEAADRLTPLRSEMRTLGRWSRGPRSVDRFEEEEEEEEDEMSDGSEGSYETNEEGISEGTPFEITGPLREALVSLSSHLMEPETISAETADWALKYVQHEWLKAAARKASEAKQVEALVEEMKQQGEVLVKTVVNITDQNGNTALHYAVSHGNFDVVSSLLDSGDCQLNLANKAGYTAVMLAALCSLDDDVERMVVQRLFEMGDVNARATQHGQTALMLAVSHGKKAAAELLIGCGADVNLQDEEGSTALMCAAEHGHREMVKLLLSSEGIDAALTDCDSSTALSIAVENGHGDIGVLIYAHLNM